MEYVQEQQSSFLNLAISIPLFNTIGVHPDLLYIECLQPTFFTMYLHVEIKKQIRNKNKNIFKKMSGYVGFLPPPTYFLHTLLGSLHAIVTDHSVYVGSMWVGVRILYTQVIKNIS